MDDLQLRPQTTLNNNNHNNNTCGTADTTSSQATSATAAAAAGGSGEGQPGGGIDLGLAGPVNGNGNCGNGGVQDQDTASGNIQVKQSPANSGNNFTKDIRQEKKKKYLLFYA